VRKEIDPRRAWIHFVVAFTLVTRGLAQGQEVETQPDQPTPSANRPAEKEEERVIVTGSHIPTAEEVGPNPVLEINRDIIEKSGERTAADLLKRLPIDSFEGIPTYNASNTRTAGASSVALRGFDASSTLVLLDGRRLAPYPVAGGATGGITFVDLNSIPKAALGSIEILKDSASSIYGADAVAGVVNFKFRRDYRGAEITTGYGNTLDKDSGEITASGIFGAGDDNTNVTAVLNYYQRNGIFTRDRAFSGQSLSRDASPLNLQLSPAAVLAAGVPPSDLPGPRFFGHAPLGTNGEALATDYVYTRFPSSVFNTNAFSQAVPDSERYGGFVQATHKICGDELVAYADFSDQKVKTRYELAPSATGPFDVPGQTILAIPPHTPGPVVGGPSYQDTDVPLGAFNPFNPFQQIISGQSRARLAEFGNRINFNQTDAIFSTLGVKGDKLFGGSWGYDAGFRYSEVQNEAMFQGVSASRFNRILNAADAIFDPTSPQFIGTTIPYNPFGDYRRPIASNFLPVDFARVDAKDLETSKLATLDLNVYTTSLFNLPAGGVGLAFGGQFRRETFGQNPDQLALEGDIIGSGKSFIVTAGRKTYAFYAETTVPIVSSANPLPLIRSLQFTAAGRFEDFRNNNTNVLVPKVGMRWQPFDESFTLRATWGEGFHEPSLVELFGNPVGNIFIGPLRDPVTHIPAFDVPFVTRGNPHLQPEDSRSFSGGFVYTPKFIQGLTWTVDLWDIESTSRAFIPGVQNVVDRAAAGKSLPLENVIRDPLTGEITFINLAFQNAGSRKAEGADFGLNYQVETRIGTFNSDTQVTYIESLQFAETSDVPEVEIRANGDVVGSDIVPLKWKGTSRLDWTWHGVSSGITAYYLDGFHEDVLRPALHLYIPHYVSQTWLFDVRASYTFNFVPPASASPTLRDKESISPPVTEAANFECSGWRRLLNGTTVTIGCNNVFGQDPPFSGAQGFVHYPQFLYDPTGRFVYASLTKKF
jgi:iron complex outermembrane receptor protein